MKSTEKQPIVITGTMVMRAVYILAILMLVWTLIADMLKIQSLDTGTVVVLIGSITCMEASLQAEKKKKEEEAS